MWLRRPIVAVETPWRRSGAPRRLLRHGGRSRFVAARLRDACHTIAKLVAKRQRTLVERQIEQVDWAVVRAGDDSRGSVATALIQEQTLSDEVRRANGGINANA